MQAVHMLTSAKYCCLYSKCCNTPATQQPFRQHTGAQLLQQLLRLPGAGSWRGDQHLRLDPPRPGMPAPSACLVPACALPWQLPAVTHLWCSAQDACAAFLWLCPDLATAWRSLKCVCLIAQYHISRPGGGSMLFKHLA